MNKILAYHERAPLMHSLQTRRNKQIKTEWTQMQRRRGRAGGWGGRSQKRAAEGRRKRGRREFSELLLEPEKSFLLLKSSRCGLVPEKEKQAGRWRQINWEAGGRGFIKPWPSARIVISLPSTSKISRLWGVNWALVEQRLGER